MEGEGDPAEQEDIGDELFIERQTIHRTISSYTMVTVECEFSPEISLNKRSLHNLASDLPGEPVLEVEGTLVKGEEVVLSCGLEDRGHPEASQFVWMK